MQQALIQKVTAANAGPFRVFLQGCGNGSCGVEAMLFDVADDLIRSKRPSKPPTPLLCDTGDATPEALIAHLVRQCKDKKALLYFKDEASEHFLGMALEMKNGRGSSLGLFLE